MEEWEYWLCFGFFMGMIWIILGMIIESWRNYLKEQIRKERS